MPRERRRWQWKHAWIWKHAPGKRERGEARARDPAAVADEPVAMQPPRALDAPSAHHLLPLCTCDGCTDVRMADGGGSSGWCMMDETMREMVDGAVAYACRHVHVVERVAA